jgi:plasmid stabilization system protein ParE
VARIVWTHEAERWLRDIYDFIAVDNAAAAVDTVQGIYDRAQVLAEFPEIGYRYSASPRDVRILLYGHYRIAYLVTGKSVIEILGVFHGALDITRYQL